MGLVGIPTKPKKTDLLLCRFFPFFSWSFLVVALLPCPCPCPHENLENSMTLLFFHHKASHESTSFLLCCLPDSSPPRDSPTSLLPSTHPQAPPPHCCYPYSPILINSRSLIPLCQIQYLIPEGFKGIHSIIIRLLHSIIFNLHFMAY